jgi:hypothetical protein
MTKKFTKRIKKYFQTGTPLSMKDISELKEKYVLDKDRNKVDAILEKYGYGVLTWKNWKKRIDIA